MDAYDGTIEQQMRDTRSDKAVGQNLSSEAAGLFGLSAWQGVQDSRAATQSPLFDFGQSFIQDAGGNRVSLDSWTGKLLTNDRNGNKVDYESMIEGEKNTTRNAASIGTLFLGSPLALFGMGAAMTLVDTTQTQDQQNNMNRMRDQLDPGHADRSQTQHQTMQQRMMQPKGYLSDITMAAMLINDKKLPVQDLYGLAGLAPDLFSNQRLIERNARSNDDKKKKKKIDMDKMAGVERKRQQMRVKLSIDRSSITSVNLSKRKRQVENEIEAAQGKSTLAEVSKLHSELEMLDKAITRLSNLGL